MKNITMPSLLLFLVVLLQAPAPVQAVYDYRYDSKEDLHHQYESSAGAKMTRGITNVLFGWTEIVRTPVEMSAGIQRGKFTAILLGVPYGILRFVGRTFVGIYEVATFYAPQGPIMPSIQGEVL